MSDDVELRRIVKELKDLNSNLAHTNRLLRDFGMVLVKKNEMKKEEPNESQ